ncbi:hypothetical protein MPSEU_000732600 [Mayamaea pseudoterrestris]|nr:hypothetical protein MPSEU_000732600 [Mayamaea pseudoterrestris]
MDVDKESLWSRLCQRCLPKTALGAGKMACLVSTCAMLLGMALLITSQVLQHQHAQDSAPSQTFVDTTDYDSLNQEWIHLREELVPNITLVLPHSPQARALMWLSALNQQNSTKSPSPLPISERYALAVLYYHWTGWAWHIPHENSLAGGGWNLTYMAQEMQQLLERGGTDECEWFGVTCADNAAATDGVKTVTGLNMTGGTNFFLRGTIPSELGLLSNMQAFSVESNHLLGTVPHELSAWSDLRKVSFRFNLLTGLGESYKSWTQLEVLELGENKFHGNISSAALRNMSNLHTLTLSNNRELRADAPLFIDADSINGPHWPKLEYVSVAVTQVEVDLSYFSAKNYPVLKSIDAGQAAFAGSIPATIGGLTHLELLNMINPVAGQLSGSIPSEIGLLSDTLTFLALDASGISGSIPTEVGELTNLQLLSVIMNSITGSFPTEIGNMASLEQLSVYQTHLTGTIPTQVGRCTKLAELQVMYTDLTGSMPTEICALKDNTQDELFMIAASCAVRASSATQRMITCTCCAICYGD